MTYAETIDYLYQQLPMFTRIGSAAYNGNLNKINRLNESLDYPSKKFKSIHVAGTNGKGSTAHFLCSILMEVGYKVGLYTSPHLIDFRERIKINGIPIAQQRVVTMVEQNKKLYESIEPSFFEMTVAMAFQYFAEENVDIAVIEVGMGGRLDATNIITPILSIITNIGFDHMAFLGNTLPLIAKEKGGIIKENIPVVISEKQEEIMDVWETIANKNKSPLFIASEKYSLYNVAFDNFTLKFDVCKNGKKYITQIESSLIGKYQLKNITGVIQSCEILNKLGWKILPKHIIHGLKKVVVNTQFQGRWQILQQQPLVVADVAHNIDGIKQVLEILKGYTFKNLHWIIGMVKDKSIDEILSILPKNATYYYTQANMPRALEANILSEKGNEIQLKGKPHDTPLDALENAIQHAEPNDMILIAGSCFILDEVLKHYQPC